MPAQDISRVHAKAMLVSLNISQWSARKIDKKAARDVQLANNAESQRGAYYKSLIEGGALEDIKLLATKARAEHYRRTLPWSDAGPRVLPNAGFMEYTKAMQDFGIEFESLTNKFVTEYPLMRQEASRLLGDLFNDADYPTLQCVAAKFAFRTTITPLPIGDDFRCDLGSEEVDRIRAEITASSQAAMQDAMRDAFDRVGKVVDTFVDRLASPGTTFRDSLVANAEELAAVLPSLNITGDPRLEALTATLNDKLCIHTPSALRNDPEARLAAYNAAMSMHTDLNSFFAGEFQ